MTMVLDRPLCSMPVGTTHKDKRIFFFLNSQLDALAQHPPSFLEVEPSEDFNFITKQALGDDDAQCSSRVMCSHSVMSHQFI